MIATFARTQIAAAAVAVGLTAFTATHAHAQSAPDYGALLAASDRSDNDKQADKRRDPLPFLQFAAPRPGMKVLDMGAGGGYSTELMSRAVAPNGMVYGQNPADASDKMKASFDARLATPAMKDAAADVRPFDDPAPPGVPLDMITFLFFYHDTTYMTVDRVAMDKAMFAALKPGGVLIIADHAALPGQGTTVGKTLHRIDEDTLKKEVEAAGFKLVDEGSFWRASADTKDYPSYKKDVPIDNFVLKFQKPN
ncbi:MAG: methyltransferase domain-containing protein [Xanthobacteraceae bacterium]